MNRNLHSLLLLGICLSACAGGNAELKKDIEQLKLKVAVLEEEQEKDSENILIAPAATGTEDQAPRIKYERSKKKQAASAKKYKRSRPDPKDVFFVEIGTSPYSGPKHAKVTIVEAFEFA